MKKSRINALSKYGVSLVAIAVLTLLTSAPFITPVQAHAAEVINTWWPLNGAHVTGTQPFKALVPGLDVSQYEMFWQVDGGSWNWMDSNYTDYPHKEASVTVGTWNWHGSGPYTVNFIARRNGSVIASYPVTIYIDTPSSVPQIQTLSVPQPAPAPAPVSQPVVTVTAPALVTATAVAPAIIPVTVSTPANPLSSMTLHVNPNSAAALQANAWQTTNPSGAKAMSYLAAQPTAIWLGEWNANVAQDVRSAVTDAQAKGAVPTFVAYAIPQRDCGGYSSGGTNNPSAYSSWINQVANGIGNGKAIVILEPDALAQITCLSGSDQSTRLSLIGSAVATLKKNPGTMVYIDAGHSGWIDAGTMANRLMQANIAAADGFALNVSNFMPTSDELTYGTAVSKLTNNKHFVIDTARNGNGSDGNWCNPGGRATGKTPTTATGNPLADAYLWLKVPGESDGTCNGGPSAGSWWPSYALTLVQNAHIAGL
jgi:endoglucanase